MKKVIFISFDFGLKGDYDNLYKWLDENKAVERGYGLAYIREYETTEKILTDKDFIAHIRRELEARIKIGSNDRIYLIWNGIEDKTKVRSGFLFGSSKQSPWTGFAQNNADEFQLDF